MERALLLLEERMDNMIEKEVVKVMAHKDAEMINVKEKMVALEAELEKMEVLAATSEKMEAKLEKMEVLEAELEKKNTTGLALNCSEADLNLDLNQTLVTTATKGLFPPLQNKNQNII